MLLGGYAATAVTVRVAPHVAALFSSTLAGRAAVQRPYWEPFTRPLLMVLAIGVAYWHFGRGRCCLYSRQPSRVRAAATIVVAPVPPRWSKGGHLRWLLFAAQAVCSEYDARWSTLLQAMLSSALVTAAESAWARQSLHAAQGRTRHDQGSAGRPAP